jgi:hypothetical protein
MRPLKIFFMPISAKLGLSQAMKKYRLEAGVFALF